MSQLKRLQSARSAILLISMKKVGNWFVASWVGLLLFTLAVAVIVSLLWFGLGDALPGLSKNEVSQAASSSTLQKLIDNPIGLPHKTLQFATQKIQPSSSLGIRSASALIGLFTIGCFYYVLRNWYYKRIAVFGTLVFATSAWFLHTARLGTDSSMYLLLFGSVACITWVQKSRGSMFALVASAGIVALLLYIPGMIWFVVPAVLWQVGRLTDILEGRSAVLLTFLSLLVLAALAPIGWALYQQPELVRAYFGLPHVFPEPLQVVKNIADIPVQLFVRGPNDPEVWLGRLPLLNVFSIVMFIAGSYAFVKKRKLDRTWFTAFVLLVSGLLVGLGGPVNLAIILPFMYLVVAAGIALMLQQWLTVFPRNPFARSVGAITMTIVVLLAAYSGFSQYFIAWQNTPETKAVFIEQIE